MNDGSPRRLLAAHSGLLFTPADWQTYTGLVGGRYDARLREAMKLWDQSHRQSKRSPNGRGTSGGLTIEWESDAEAVTVTVRWDELGPFAMRVITIPVLDTYAARLVLGVWPVTGEANAGGRHES